MTKSVKIGDIKIGANNPIAIQSMSTCKISNTKKAIIEAQEVERAGCDIFRFSVLDEQDAFSFREIKKHVKMPLVADIHFDYRLAIKSIEGGADKIRINPGNIGSENNIKELSACLRANGVPVRVGSNLGSLEKEFLNKFGRNEIALGESALSKVAVLEKQGVENIVVSVKASSVPLMVKAYKYVSERCNYPLHVGVTEAGTEYSGIIKNAIGIGSLLLSDIGDTIRVSLSDSPVKEVLAGAKILRSLGLKNALAEVVACPTCGRCEWDCMTFAKEVEDYLSDKNKPIKVAVMGCVVNGPGEAGDADLGIAGGKDGCVIFVKGKIVKKLQEEQAKKAFFAEIDKCLR